MVNTLVALNKVLLSLFTVDLKEIGIKVGSVSRKGLISPSAHIFVGKGKLHWHAMLLFVHLEFFGEGGLDSSLEEFNLVAVVSLVVENLPLLYRSFVHF